MISSIEVFSILVVLALLNSTSYTGLTTRCIGLAALSDPSTPTSSPLKIVKIGKVGYHTRLLDLHRSNPFGPNIVIENDTAVPEAW